jgi:hypothetical protein
MLKPKASGMLKEAVCPDMTKGISEAEMTKETEIRIKARTLRTLFETHPIRGRTKAPATGIKTMLRSKILFFI